MSVQKLWQVAKSGGTPEEEALLRGISEQAIPLSEEAKELIEDLRDTMWSFDVCVGLAAPQIGKSVRVAVVNWERKSREEDLLLIDPVVRRNWGKRDVKRESCMSLWGYTGSVERRSKLEVEYSTVEGQRVVLSLHGFPARAVQHEVEHLDGIMYDERLTPGSSLQRTDLFDVDDAGVE